MHSEYPLISVIVPVYNVEKYLRRCVDSILAQTYPNIEIILVNDGSPDNSQVICEEYENSAPRVRVLKKLNGGQSSARNLGLTSAQGEYVGFIDSDDWISPDMYMTLFNLINDNDAAASQINLMMADNEQVKPSDEVENIEIISGRENILRYYLDSGTRKSGSYSVCRCLFPTSIAKKYKFREGKVNEDIDYKYRVLRDCKRFVASNKICYYYFQSGDSTSSGILKKRDFDLYDAAGELVSLTNEEKDETIRFLGKVKEARTPFSLLCRIAYYGISENVGNRKEIIKKLTAGHRGYLPTLLKAPLPLSRKILALGFALNFKCVELPLRLLAKMK